MEDDSNALHRRTQTTPNSIPLQDLSRPPEHSSSPVDGPDHRRTLSDRGRRLFASSSARQSGRYSPLPPVGDALRPAGLAIPSVRTVPPSDTAHTWLDEAESTENTPMVDRSSFQDAIGFAGISFQQHSTADPFSTSNLPHDAHGLNNLLGRNESQVSLSSIALDDTADESPPVEFDNDTTPLTDMRHAQPMAGATAPLGQRHDRLSLQIPRHGQPIGNRRPSHLGDDLAAAESGLHTPESSRSRAGSHARSLSPSSPLYRASSVVRKMSQRVVNLSNEPELVEQEMQRRLSDRQRDATKAKNVLGITADGTHSPLEKPPSQASVHEEAVLQDWVRHANPFRGNSLGLFPPHSKLRTRLCDLLIHPLTEPLILVLIVFQTIILAVEAAPDWFEDPDSLAWNNSWTDFALLALFIIYTIEVAIRCIVSGFVVNPIEYSTINRHIGLKQAVSDKAHSLFALHRDAVDKHASRTAAQIPQESIIRTFTYAQGGDQAHDKRQPQRVRLAHRAYLRHSFNRVDFIAVVSYWVGFAMAISGFEEAHHVHAFRMLSCLRILRLLSLTRGTSIILRSLKKAAPLLLNVALLIGFFWLLFAIVGVQSFKSSFRRNCVWVDPTGQQANWTTNAYQTFQFCGGSTDVYGNRYPWQYADGTSSNVTKGYLCPANNYCVSDSNPFNGTVSYDNIFQSLELVFVIMTTNTYSDLMYYLMDSDFMLAALFFAVGVIILFFWMVNLLIAVITASFQVIREESQTSAFASEQEQSKEQIPIEEPVRTRPSSLALIYDKTYWLWIAVITYGLICQCLRSAYMSQARASFINVSETIVTLALMLEIVFRFAAQWRTFFKSKRNWVDLGLVVITTIIQIPPIHNSGQPYAWLTVFQILRVYRVVLAVPWTRDLILLVFGKASAFANLILFVFLLTFLVAIFASQLFRGEIPTNVDWNGNAIYVTFNNIFNCFLGMYQIYSSENWTTILYMITAFDDYYNTAWIGAIFFILWFILGYFIVLSMFIAAIQESFDVSEDDKRLQQVKAFLQQKELGGSSNSTLSLSSLFKLSTLMGRRQDPLDYGPAMTELLLKDTIVKDFLDEDAELLTKDTPNGHTNGQPNGSRVTSMARPASINLRNGFAASWWRRIKARIWDDTEPNPFYTNVKFSRAYEDLDARTMAQEVVSGQERRKKAQREYLIKYPNYNNALFIFKPNNPLRRICQRMVGPGRGQERIEGVAPNPVVWYAFSAIIYASIVAMVILACITTPLYQRDYWQNHVYSIKNWFVWVDMAFAAIFTVEALIRMIADGFFSTPNAYYRSAWGLIDGFVLLTLWINVLTSLFNQGGVSRAVGAFKALRALRLLNVSDSARDTFHAVIVRGGWKVLSAAFVSISLLIPFAIYGLNLFNGQMQACNDPTSGIYDLNDCVNEFMNNPSQNWYILTPRQVSNAWYSFDNFASSLFILFQIVSLEGWVDVMYRAMSIQGFYLQPSYYNLNGIDQGNTVFVSPGNAVFFVVFNLLGAVFVLTLFVSVFMRNYAEQTGVAFLTTEQRSWLELRNVLKQVSPSKRPPSSRKRQTWRQWCYLRSVRKNGRWSRTVTVLLILHLILLCSESYPEPMWWQETRDVCFLVLTLFYIVNIVIRIFGLTWMRFRRSSWDVYSLFAVSGTFITTLILLSNYHERVYEQLHNYFLVSIVLLLIPRNNQLDQLFKTAAASFTVIGNLLATWFVLFLVYAIAFTQTFGLTRFTTNETDNLNFRNVPKALILLFRMSTGEGWDQIMTDFAYVVPPWCTVSDNFLESDCGSAEWAHALFISWNILSMYIFTSMFVSLIYESFSYVYQRSSGLSVISRSEVRRFKQAWSEYDPDGTGFISKEVFPRFLGELTGVFEMRIYPHEYSVGNVKNASLAPSSVPASLPFDIDNKGRDRRIDLDMLNRNLSDMPVEEIRMRRQRMRAFYEEVMVTADPDRGIGFNSLLMILTHYKVINDNKSLRLEEFLRRRARLQRVEEAVRRSIVVGFFDTLYWSRRFRRHMESKRAGRMTDVPTLQVPEIFVDNPDDDSNTSTPDSSAPKRPTLSVSIPKSTASESSISSRDFAQQGSSLGRSDSIQVSPMGTGHGVSHSRERSSGSPSIPTWEALSPTARRSGSPQMLSSPHMSPNVSMSTPPAQLGASPPRPSHGSSPSFSGGLGAGLGLQVPGGHSRTPSEEAPVGVGAWAGEQEERERKRSRTGSNVSARDVLEVLDNSAWGESIRRSFTLKRGGSGGGGGRSPARSSGGRSEDGVRRSETGESRTSGGSDGTGGGGGGGHRGQASF